MNISLPTDERLTLGPGWPIGPSIPGSPCGKNVTNKRLFLIIITQNNILILVCENVHISYNQCQSCSCGNCNSPLTEPSVALNRNTHKMAANLDGNPKTATNLDGHKQSAPIPPYSHLNFELSLQVTVSLSFYFSLLMSM